MNKSRVYQSRSGTLCDPVSLRLETDSKDSGNKKQAGIRKANVDC